MANVFRLIKNYFEIPPRKANAKAFIFGVIPGATLGAADLIFQIVPISNFGLAITAVPICASAAIYLVGHEKSDEEGGSRQFEYTFFGLGLGLALAAQAVSAKHISVSSTQEHRAAIETPARPTRNRVEIVRDGDKVIAKLTAGFEFNKPGLG
jgi:hypothetical protein